MYFEIYKSVGGLLGTENWRWRLKGANHEILASGEGYASKQNCLRGIELIKQTTLMTPVRDALS